MLEKLEEKEDKSFVMAPLCKMRNHCYTIAASCMINSFSDDYIMSHCNIMNRLIYDLQQNGMNDFIFINLIDMLRSFKKNNQAIRILFDHHAYTLIDLIQNMEDTPSKRLSLIKTIVFLILKAPDELCVIDSAIFG